MIVAEKDLERGILVIDYGSQTTLLIARRLRELGVYSEIWPCTDSRLVEHGVPPCLGLVLSGSPASLGDDQSPKVTAEMISGERPVLGICYGMQLITDNLGAKVAPADTREFGRTQVIPEPGADNPLLQDFPASGSFTWMSHNDTLVQAPPEVQVSARTAAGLAAAIQVQGRPLYGVQFHPEVSHTELGKQILRRFAFDVCGAAGDWSAGNLVQQKVAEIAETVGSARIICGLSGGVDSAVTAALIARAVGRQLVCILVDNGLLRHAEADEVETLFRDRFDVELRVVDAQQEFLGALEGVVDPEAKRKAIGKTFIDIFEASASDVEGVKFLAQGTLYPDVVESAGVRGPSAVIKSHHNVGGLPERLPFELLEPLRNLFKDEVRELGLAMGLPKRIIGRHPFPGPGLAVRILGEVTEERLAIVREADRIYIEALHELDLYDQIWQAFVVLLPVRTVGVMGDARTYEKVIALRAVTSRDGMTADRSHLPMEALGLIADRITNNVAGVNRVVYDLSSKPPATIEWE